MNQPQFSITTQDEKPGYGKIIIEPLEQGYGHTVGNAIRRVLLSSLPGSAITSVKIEGIQHQFSTLAGLKEDIVEFVLNLKKVRLVIEGEEQVKLTINKKGPGEITAADISCPAGVTIINPDMVLGNLSDKKASLNAEITAKKGFGYVSVEENSATIHGEIPLDAEYSPVLIVNYKVEATRVGRMTNLDKLVFEIWTNGTISASEAVKSASEILIGYFQQIFEPVIRKTTDESAAVSSKISDEILKTRIEELDIPTRIVNALAKAKIETIGQIISVPKADLMKIKNLGGKSLSVVQDQIQTKGVSLME
jgi:DNA-directed RNA polymerase subunit alpha